MRKIIFNFTPPASDLMLRSCTAPAPPPPKEGCTVTLSPSDIGDYNISVYDNGREIPPDYFRLWSVGYYLHAICGFPFSPVEFCTSWGIVNCEFWGANDRNVGIILPKCKRIVTKTIELPCEVSGEIATAPYHGGLYRVLLTKCEGAVSHSALRGMRILRGQPDCRGAIAVTDDAGIGTENIDLMVGASLTYSYCTGCRCEKGAVTVKYDRVAFCILDLGDGRVCIYPTEFRCTAVTD